MPTYKIVRHYFDESHPDNRKVIATGLTVEHAKEHCSDESTSERDPETGQVIWFDAWTEE